MEFQMQRTFVPWMHALKPPESTFDRAPTLVPGEVRSIYLEPNAIIRKSRTGDLDRLRPLRGSQYPRRSNSSR